MSLLVPTNWPRIPGLEPEARFPSPFRAPIQVLVLEFVSEGKAHGQKNADRGPV